MKAIRSIRARLALGTILTVALLGALTTSADARWIRGLSDISSYGDDISVCADEITIGFEVVHQFDSFDAFYPTFDKTVGEPYPGLNPQSVGLYASAADAIARTNSVVTFSIPISYAGTSGGGYQFLGETTLPTPTGFGDGDVLYAYSYDFDLLQEVAVPLTIGDSAYDCAEAPADPVFFDVFTLWDLVFVNSPVPTVVIFDGGIDSSSLVVTAEPGTGAPVSYLGSIWGIGVALVDLDAAGLTCDSSSLTLSGQRPDGTPVVGETNINPVGLGC